MLSSIDEGGLCFFKYLSMTLLPKSKKIIEIISDNIMKPTIIATSVLKVTYLLPRSINKLAAYPNK